MAKAKATKATKATKAVDNAEMVDNTKVAEGTAKVKTPKPTLATATVADTAKPAKKPKAAVIEIIRGRMPLVMVFSIKFLETGSISEIAAKYQTTMGKVDDIKKGANFGYIKETFKPTADMVKAAVPRCKELIEGKEILTMINNIGIATPEDDIAFIAIKNALRKKKVKIDPLDTKEPITKISDTEVLVTEIPVAKTLTTEDAKDLATDDEDLLDLLK